MANVLTKAKIQGKAQGRGGLEQLNKNMTKYVNKISISHQVMGLILNDS